MPKGIKGSGKKKEIEEVKPWKPEPKIDSVPPEIDAYCENMTDPYTKCGHSRKMHYGGLKGHCNTSGCHCQEFK